MNLINGVYEQASLAGSPCVYWQTHETNHTAMLLYDRVAERSGFQFEGVLRSRVEHRGTWVDVWIAGFIRSNQPDAQQ